MYIITGSPFGSLGRSVTRHLQSLVPASQIILAKSQSSTHIPDTTVIQVRNLDYESQASLREGWSGARKLLFLDSPSIRPTRSTDRAAIEVAIDSGVNHIYFAVPDFTDNTSYEPMKRITSVVDYIKSRAGDVSYTIIKEGYPSEAWGILLGTPAMGYRWAEQENIVFRVPTDGKVAWVSRDDAAQGIAKIMASDKYANETVSLTGETTYTLTQTVSFIEKILTKKATLQFVSLDETIEALSKRLGPEGASSWATIYPALHRGELGNVSPVLRQLIGQPKAFEDVLRMKIAKRVKGIVT